MRGLLTGNVYQAEIVERIVVERRQPNGFAQRRDRLQRELA